MIKIHSYPIDITANTKFSSIEDVASKLNLKSKNSVASTSTRPIYYADGVEYWTDSYVDMTSVVQFIGINDPVTNSSISTADVLEKIIEEHEGIDIELKDSSIIMKVSPDAQELLREDIDHWYDEDDIVVFFSLSNKTPNLQFEYFSEDGSQTDNYELKYGFLHILTSDVRYNARLLSNPTNSDLYYFMSFGKNLEINT